MTIVSVTHGYPPGWNMGGEVSLHRTVAALPGERLVLTRTTKPYALDGVNVAPVNMPDVLDINADPTPLVWQFAQANAHIVIAQNELSLPAVKAAHILGIPAVVSIHTPPRYGRGISEAVKRADAVIVNTEHAASEWAHRHSIVVHPPIGDLPAKPKTLPQGDAYTLLSNLANKGVECVLGLAKHLPDQRFIIVRSPAEPTHGLADFDERAASLPNVEVKPRVAPERVHEYLAQTRILLVPSRYETYGMSTIEAAGYGIPTVHIDTPHVREGIGNAAYLVSPPTQDEVLRGINTIEADYATWSHGARTQAEALAARQRDELANLADWITHVRRHPGR